jgi:hypothetical protein
MTTREVFSIFQDRVVGRPTDRRWSLAQLRVTDGELALVRQWYASLDEAKLDRIAGSKRMSKLRSYKAEENLHFQCGLLLGILFCETARREATEGRVWGVLSRLPCPVVYRHFFMSNGQPTVFTKKLLEESFREWGLRNIFSEIDRHEWKGSLFLQFGFTRKGAEKNLPQWLAGQRTSAIEDLLGDSSNNCPEFVTLWRELLRYRRGGGDQMNLRRSMARTSWLLPEWSDRIVILAREKLHLDDYSPSSNESSEPHEPRLVDLPELTWEPGREPSFRCAIVVEEEIELERISYELRVKLNEQEHLRKIISLQEDGSHHVFGDHFLELPLTHPELSVMLITLDPDRGERIVQTQRLELWDKTQPMNFYPKHGRIRRLWTDGECPTWLAQRGAYAIHPQALELSDQTAMTTFDNGRWRISELAPGDPGEILLRLEGEDYWWISDTQGNPAAAERKRLKDKWGSRISARIVDLENGHPQDKRKPSASLRLKFPEELSLRKVQAGRDSLSEKTVRPGQITTEPFPLKAEYVKKMLKVTANFDTPDGRYTHHCSIETGVKRIIFEDGAQHRYFKGTKGLSASLCERSTFFYPPELIDESKDWEAQQAMNISVMEGMRCIATFRKRPIRLRGLAGYGGRLWLKYGTFNQPEEICEMASHTQDLGLIRSVWFDNDGLVIKIVSPVTPTAKHRLIIWCNRRDFITIQGDLLEAILEEDEESPSRKTWRARLDLSSGDYQIKGVAILYDECLLGSYFEENLSFLGAVNSENEAKRAAEALRYFRAPIVKNTFYQPIQELLKKYFKEVLSIWLPNNALSPQLGIAPQENRSEWLVAISAHLNRNIRAEVNPTSAFFLAKELYDHTLTGEEGCNFFMELQSRPLDTFWVLFESLEGIAPRFAVKLVHQLSKQPFAGEVQWQELVNELTISDQALAEVLERTHVDRYFFENFMSALSMDDLDMDEKTEMNFHLLLNQPEFLRLALVKLLQSCTN